MATSCPVVTQNDVLNLSESVHTHRLKQQSPIRYCVLLRNTAEQHRFPR